MNKDGTDYYRFFKNQQKGVINHFLLVKIQFLLEKIPKISSYQSRPYFMWKSSVHPSIKYFYAVLLLTYNFLFSSKHVKI